MIGKDSHNPNDRNAAGSVTVSLAESSPNHTTYEFKATVIGGLNNIYDYAAEMRSVLQQFMRQAPRQGDNWIEVVEQVNCTIVAHVTVRRMKVSNEGSELPDWNPGPISFIPKIQNDEQ